MDSHCWTSTLNRRLSRRRTLQAATGLGAGAVALSLIGCGSNGGSSNGGSSGTANSMLTEPKFLDKSVPKGGIMKDFAISDVPSLDPLTTTSFRIYTEGPLVFSTWLQNGIGARGKKPTAEAITGDVMQSWEIAPDGSQITLKLRPGQKFDPRAPTNGRVLTVDDVKWSYDRFASSANSAPDVIQAKNPDAPFLGVTTPDSSTVVLKLAYPYGDLLSALAYNWYLWVLPKEAESQYDPKKDVRGTGPFMLTNYEPSVGLQYRRRDDWYQGPNRPYLDGIDRPIVTEYATQLAQFRAGAIASIPVKADDVLATKKDVPQLEMSQDVDFTAIVSSFYRFPHTPGSAFDDVRVRRAFSIALDKDLMIDTFYVPDAYKQAGLPVVKRWHSHLANGSPGWIDPQGKEIGEGAKYFSYDPASAKQMLSAAGKDGLAFDCGYPTSSEHPDAAPYFQIMMDMVSQIGMKPTSHIMDYNTDWRTDCQSGGTVKFPGVCYSPSNAATVDAYLGTRYVPNGRFNLDIKPIGAASDLVMKHRGEFDPQKQLDLEKQMQQILAVEMPGVPWPGTALLFNLKWPWFGNRFALSVGGASAREETYWYLDPSKLKT